MSEPDLYRSLTAVERERLTGEATAEGQRVWCDAHAVPHTCREHVDECAIWLDERFDALLGGYRDPAVGSFGALPASCPLAAA